MYYARNMEQAEDGEKNNIFLQHRICYSRSTLVLEDINMIISSEIVP